VTFFLAPERAPKREIPGILGIFARELNAKMPVQRTKKLAPAQS
jgi:hypothetical protein